ncbi:hypothetical protein P6709_13475 [Jeotgalibacillus sp. ET6]|uniref:hypothetical protein n=1 Tax=Jeotgalibacillus sp. ET6 TaxID=3037260 RepID=UPI00241888DB|nr:hypothetical protein [Jeotgalibacillus sp. ET6]MDG5472762.1 hypothetical protein [Jeotgalibacillus sp. ET6]
MLVWIFAVLTIGSVIAGVKQKRKRWFALPIAALFGYMAIEIIRVPMPLWDTITFIFDLKG